MTTKEEMHASARRESLHELVEALPEGELATAQRLLEALRLLSAQEELYTADMAPIDDEPETDEERAAVAEAKAELARGEGIPAAEVYREFGV
jgi:hypothetical protein